MKKKTFSLPIDAFSSIPLDHYPDDFTFIVNGTSFPTKRFIADLLSPKIRNFHFTDETYDRISIETKEEGNFSDLLNIAIKGKFTFPQSKIKYVYEIFSLLDNFEFIDSTGFFSDEITVNNVFDKINVKNSFKLSIDDEIEFLAKHMVNLSTQIKKLDISFIELILSNDHLLVESEDWLYEFVKSIDLTLLEYIKFGFLSEGSMNDFITKFDISNLNIGIWNSICERLKMKIERGNKEINSNSDRYQTQVIDIKYEGNGLKGIISYLNKKSKNKRNSIDHSKIESELFESVSVTSSTTYSNSYAPENVLQLENDSLFGSKNQPDQWICFDFKDNLVQVKSYSIRSSNFWGQNQEHPRNWILECSNDKKRWKTIDKRTDCNELNEKGVTKTFIVESQHKKSRYFRLKQTGENCKGNYCFNISAVEFFGKLTLKQ